MAAPAARPASEHDGAEAGREPEQADQHRHGLHRIGDGEAAVENAQRELPDLARRAEVDPGAAGQRADRVHGLRRRRARREPQRRVVHAPVARERGVIGAVDENRAVLAGVIAEHSSNTNAMLWPLMGSWIFWPGEKPYRSLTASLIHTAAGSPARRRYCRPTFGNAFSARSRAISTSGGRAGSRRMRPERRKSARATCGSARTRSSNPGSR